MFSSFVKFLLIKLNNYNLHAKLFIILISCAFGINLFLTGNYILLFLPQFSASNFLKKTLNTYFFSKSIDKPSKMCYIGANFVVIIFDSIH